MKSFNFRGFYFLVSLACLASTSGQAASFTSSAIQSMMARVPAPPKVGSDTDLKDLQGVVEIQNAASEFEIKRAGVEANCTLESFFGQPYGLLNEKQLIVFEQLYKVIYQASDAVTNTIKAKYNRTRPYYRKDLKNGQQVKQWVDIAPRTSYPSGHTAIAMSTAHVLGLLFPAHKAQFITRAQQVGRDRIIGGAHHPKDVEAGFLVGDLVFAQLQKMDEFNELVYKVKSELIDLNWLPVSDLSPELALNEIPNSTLFSLSISEEKIAGNQYFFLNKNKTYHTTVYFLKGKVTSEQPYEWNTYCSLYFPSLKETKLPARLSLLSLNSSSDASQLNSDQELIKSKINLIQVGDDYLKAGTATLRCYAGYGQRLLHGGLRIKNMLSAFGDSVSK